MKYSFVVSIEVKDAMARYDDIRKHVRNQVGMGSASLHGCHIKRVTVGDMQQQTGLPGRREEATRRVPR